MESKTNIAVLIDGDNAQPKLIKEILEEVSKHGKATIRRIYGDWTNPIMNGWKKIINENSISPVQKFSYTSGKNSTDGSLIIDAMDILHGQKVDGFCIVSSDSDFTGLAKRIREEGLFVMGIGQKKTPISFVQSCEIFTFSENLTKDTESKILSIKGTTKKNKFEKLDLDIIDRAYNISSGEENDVYIAKIGLNLRKIDPSFDTRTYGFRNLTGLLESLDNYEIVKNEVNGMNHPLVRPKDTMKVGILNN